MAKKKVTDPYLKVYLKSGRDAGHNFYADYNPPDKTLVVNNNPDDKDLKPIEIPLPVISPEEVTKIPGYGDIGVLQFFKTHAEQYPRAYRRLMDLQKKCNTVDECLQKIRDNSIEYAEEIEYIQREWQYRLNGYWFWNNKRPVYITGTHWLYLNHWFAGKGHPEYRSRDRKFFIFADFVDKDPLACGFNYPKFRREGATSKTSCLLYDLITREKSVHGGIQSKDDDSAKNVFHKHVVQSWKKISFWFKPVQDGISDPKSSLNFFAPSRSSISGSAANVKESLESWIDFGASTEGHYDGTKLRFHYGDESGKSSKINIYTRHTIVKPCITEGNTYVGIIVNTSTVGDMESGGGGEFKKLCKQSDYHKRNENGETITGLYNLFIPSYDGFSGKDPVTGKSFINRHGDSDEKNSKAYLLRRRKALLDSGDIDGYVEEVRQYPLTFAECFTKSSLQANFNTQIITDRLTEFQFGNDFKARGNFVWSDGKDSEVIWIPDPKNGKFLASYLLPHQFANREMMEGRVRVPGNRHRFIAGGDPFKHNDVKNEDKKSDGAGAVFMKFDPAIDNVNSDPAGWITDRFVCTYSNQPKTTEEYAEDMLKMCVYYGCEMFPETNVPLLWDHFRDRGYNGYLYYQVDKKTGKYSSKPGADTGTKIQQMIYSAWYNHIEKNGSREVHDELLEQCRDIEDDMGPFDLFVAGGYALMGANKQEASGPEKTDIKSFHRKFTYNS